ncbi:MAG: YicC family protein, partial [Ignavibacteriaceae bacterium]|nr:YicC family protein [Ignavibacteriaceae bacterium]
MILSMTGYGKGTAENEKIKVEAEVKSVNSRFLDIITKLPSSIMTKEYELREQIKNKINRGKLTVVIQIKRNDFDNEDFNLNKDKLKNYLSLIKEIKKAAKITEKIKLEHILYNKELFEAGEIDFTEEEFNVVRKALDLALAELLKTKRNEGKELAKDLRKRIEIIETKLAEIEAESKASVNEYFEKLKEKVKLLVGDIKLEKDRMEMELAIIADKAEITEECVRLKSHIKFFANSLDEEAEPGRKLNFLCQEMNRETNTISSKTISTFITHNTVFIKEEIEKIREQ